MFRSKQEEEKEEEKLAKQKNVYERKGGYKDDSTKTL